MPPDNLEKINFLLGDWNLEYKIPESIFSKPGTESGTGSFKKILNENYIMFDYSTESGGAAKGIFAWDDKIKMIRYWWFENSGSFSSAICNLINENTLAMNWHDNLFVQTFKRKTPNKIVLNMKYPTEDGKFITIMKAILTRK